MRMIWIRYIGILLTPLLFCLTTTSLELKCKFKVDDYRYGIHKHDKFEKQQTYFCACKLKQLKLSEASEKVSINKIEKCHSNSGPREVEAVHVFDSDIKFIRQSMYDKFKNLKLFLCHNCCLEELKADFFNMTSLKYLRVNQNFINIISGEVFQNVSGLERLNLADNKVVTLEGNVFKGLKNLQGLYLHRNEIQFLEPKIFHGLESLLDLFLDNNKLEILPKDLFTQNEKLERITLHKNRIFWLDSKLFDGIIRWKNITLEHNDCVDQDFRPLALLSQNPDLSNCSESLQGSPTIFHTMFERNLANLSVTYHKVVHTFTDQLFYMKSRADSVEKHITIITYALVFFGIISVIALGFMGILVKNMIM